MSLNQLFQIIQSLPPHLQKEVALFVGYLQAKPVLQMNQPGFSVKLNR